MMNRPLHSHNQLNPGEQGGENSLHGHLCPKGHRQGSLSYAVSDFLAEYSEYEGYLGYLSYAVGYFLQSGLDIWQDLVGGAHSQYRGL